MKLALFNLIEFLTVLIGFSDEQGKLVLSSMQQMYVGAVHEGGVQYDSASWVQNVPYKFLFLEVISFWKLYK